MADFRDIAASTMEAFCEEFAELVLDGWAVVKQGNKGDCFRGLGFSVSMYRDDDTVKAFRANLDGVADKPKMTRAEILQKARAAKAAKLVDSVVS